MGTRQLFPFVGWDAKFGSIMSALWQYTYLRMVDTGSHHPRQHTKSKQDAGLTISVNVSITTEPQAGEMQVANLGG